MGEWMPIASAPRDGTVILICDPHPDGLGSVAGYWAPDQSDFYVWRVLDGTPHLDGWGNWLDLLWMPLPSPPQGGADDTV